VLTAWLRYIGVGSAIPTANLVGVGLHEMSHAMGRESGASTFDLCHFTAAGTREFNSTATAAYFSVDGGTTDLQLYGVSSDPADFKGGSPNCGTDTFCESYVGTVQNYSALDIQLMNTLGFQ
jgi:hypothetical protein